jgi:hypothetical protein
MSHPVFVHIYSNGNIWFANDASFDPKSARPAEAGTLITAVRVNSDAAPQKISVMGGTTSSNLTATNGTGASGSKFTTKELT